MIKWFRTAVVICFLGFWIGDRAEAAEVYVPESEREILVRFPAGAKLRMSGTEASQFSDGALVGFARSQIELSRSSGDIRYAVNAVAALETVSARVSVSPELLNVRAIAKQYLHDFSGALVDLDAALKLQPANLQALVSRAAIFTVIGRLDDSRADCRKILGRASDLAFASCISGSAMLGPDLVHHYQVFQSILATSEPAERPDILVWAYGLLGEMAERLNEPEQALNAYRKGLEIRPGDILLRTNQADLLLDLGRASEVWSSFSNSDATEIEAVDGLLIRKAKAAGALSLDEEYHRIFKILRTRALESLQRGDFTHARELAMIFLLAPTDAPQAHKMAMQNWKISKERIDLRLLLETSRLVGDVAGLNEARAWLQTNQTIDRRLHE